MARLLQATQGLGARTPDLARMVEDFEIVLVLGISAALIPVDPERRQALLRMVRSPLPPTGLDFEHLRTLLDLVPEAVVNDKQTTELLVELARSGREEDFRFLAASQGVAPELLNDLWRGTLARLGQRGERAAG